MDGVEVKVVVTVADIIEGEACNSLLCPLAKAINRLLKECYYVVVLSRRFSIYKVGTGGMGEGPPLYEGKNTLDMTQFINAIDGFPMGNPIKREFSIYIPSDYLA